MKTKKLLRRLASLGCEAVRQKGSHQTWRTPGGRPFTLVVNHPGVEVQRSALRMIVALLAAEGLRLHIQGVKA